MNYVRVTIAILGAVAGGITHNWTAMLYAISCVLLVIHLIWEIDDTPSS